ncbi:MAG: HAMP domain-containing histidine kinase [Acidimicrobiia bacterium]|nr:HAMP domain-containing histidine kinase [Acidimicrobiia bacterium]
MSTRARSSASGSSLLRRYTWGAVAVFCLVGGLLYLLLTQAAQNEMRQRSRSFATIISAAITSSGEVQAQHLERGLTVEELLPLWRVAGGVNVETIDDWEAVRIISADGVVVVADQVGAIGEQVEVTPALAAASRGEVRQVVMDSSSDALGGLPAGRKLATYVPFRLEGEAVGALELVQDVDRDNGLVQRRVLGQLATVGVGLALLYMGLFWIVRRASRVQREQDRRAEELLEQEREQVARLQEIDAAKDDLLAFSAHEFRTPLTSLLGFAQTLESRRNELSDELVDEYLQTIVRQARRLQRVADDFLDVAAIEAGRLEVILSPTPLNTVLRDVVGEFGPPVVLDTSLEDTTVVNADRERLEQVFTNLIRNAMHHGPANGTVVVEARAGDGECHIAVVDEGSGFTAEEAVRCSAKFARGEGRARGSGLGLFLARHLVEAHGGRLDVDAAAPTTTFVVALPLFEAGEVAGSEISAVGRRAGADDGGEGRRAAPRETPAHMR